MTEFLARKFVKNHNDVKNTEVRGAYGTLTSVVGIIANLLLFVGKYLIGTLSGSLSIQADAVNNLSDAGAQLVTLFSFRISMKKPDRAHPFGYARMEYIASMAVSFLILLVGVELFKDSFAKLTEPADLKTDWATLLVLTLSILVKVWLSFFNKKIGKKIDSSVMLATATDSLSDAMSTGAVLLATVITLIFPNIPFNLDAVMGILVALLILKAGIGILNDTKNAILGEAPPDEVLQIIKDVVATRPEILGIHDVIIHSYGPNHFMVAFHAEVDGSVDVFQSHEVIDDVENILRNDYKMEATIHLDPIAVNDRRVAKIRAVLSQQLKTIGEGVMPHDVRFVPGEGHSNVVFDITLPFEITTPEAEIREKVVAMVKSIDPSYEAVFKIDRI